MAESYVLRFYDRVTQAQEIDEKFDYLYPALERVVEIRKILNISEPLDVPAITEEQLEELLRKGIVTVGEKSPNYRNGTVDIILLRTLSDREAPVISD